MYKKETQLAFEDFVFPFGELDSENEWVKLAGLIPWDTVERAYAKQFVDNGHPAHSARIALGALIIKQRLRCSDEWTDGTPCEREPLSPVLSRDEGVQLKGSLWGIHHGGVPQAFSAGGHCDDSGGQHPKESPSGS